MKTLAGAEDGGSRIARGLTKISLQASCKIKTIYSIFLHHLLPFDFEIPNLLELHPDS